MAKWRVQYQGPDKKMQTTYVTVPDDKYTTALAVQNAIEKGEIADLHLAPGAIVLVAIVLVQKYQAPSIHISRG